MIYGWVIVCILILLNRGQMRYQMGDSIAMGWERGDTHSMPVKCQCGPAMFTRLTNG